MFFIISHIENTCTVVIKITEVLGMTFLWPPGIAAAACWYPGSDLQKSQLCTVNKQRNWASPLFLQGEKEGAMRDR